MADEAQSPVLAEKNITEDEAEKAHLHSLVTELAQDYSKYLKVDASSEKATLDNDVEDILTRLDEFTSLVDMVRGDNALCLNATLPEIHKKCDEMEKVFQKIDRLEQMIQVVKQNLDQMEEKVAEAEEHLDSSSMKKIFSSLQKPLFSKKPGESKKHIKYEPPKIFSTEEFFPNSQPVSPSAEKSPSVEQT
ncbi:biogenesis of lysosome-related organelles complex 1 subunit 4-like [Uloborus diversus]|uniref:biogenesis of lysosome-related organelles complex 1 subunit 4-like n=1 Tax=Uloborus diversus TaxID=327109 RepID=UPI002409D709|nr:biogenesis of lysosome-related organelles complex 1 subunit 4-like [Uloborus diversus]